MSSAEVNTLPDGWEEKKLGEVLDNILTGTTPSKKAPKYYENPTVNWFSPSDFGVVKVLQDAKNKVSQLAIDERKAKLYEKDSLLLVAIGATVGKVGIIRKKVSSNQQITALKFMPHLNVDFAYYYFIYIKPIVVKTASAATMPIINQKTIKSLKISFPPLEEQKRIVTKIDDLFAKIDKAISLTEESLVQAKNLFTSSLSKIFNDLKQSHKSYPLMEYVDFVGGSQPPKSTFSYEMKEGFVRLIQIRDYKTDNHIVYIDKNSTKKFCESDDIMIGRYGPPVFQILKGIKGAYNVALMKAIPNESMVNREFLYYFLQSSSIQRYIISISQRSAGQSGVNKKALDAYNITLPPLEVQHKLIDDFNQLQNDTALTQSKLEQQLAYLKQLKSSILSKAFKGEL